MSLALYNKEGKESGSLLMTLNQLQGRPGSIFPSGLARSPFGKMAFYAIDF